jgi:hypothetical protein
MTTPKSIHFDIGRVTLHGYSARDRDRFEQALRTALADLAASRAGPDAPQAGAMAFPRKRGEWPAAGDRFIPLVDAGALPAGASPERAARVIAARVLGAVASSARMASPAEVTAAARGPNPVTAASSGHADGPSSTVGPSGTASPAGAAHA